MHPCPSPLPPSPPSGMHRVANLLTRGGPSRSVVVKLRHDTIVRGVLADADEDMILEGVTMIRWR